MRKPRDFDADLKALETRARELKQRKHLQLGELVIATGADVLPIEELAGALLAAVSTNDKPTREGWRKTGTAFFQRATKPATSHAGESDHGTSPVHPGAQSASGSGSAT